MAKGSKASAEASYARTQKRVRDAAKAMTEVEVEAKRIDDNTQRLRALRLAKEAADAAAAAAKPPPAKAKTKPRASKPKAGAKSTKAARPDVAK